MAVTFKGFDQALAYVKKKETAMVEAVKDVLANTATDVEKQAIASACLLAFSCIVIALTVEYAVQLKRRKGTQ